MKRLIGLLAAAALTVFTVQALAQAPETEAKGYVISDDLKALPEAVRKTRRQLLRAARSGDMAQLKAVFDAQPQPPNVSFGRPDDPIAYLKQESADGEGLEILAILVRILESPYAVMDTGDGEPIYIWPYLAAMDDLQALTPQQRVDAYLIAGHERLETMKDFGGWIYWRALIGQNGALMAFVAGD